MPFTEDLSVFFNPTEHGTAALLDGAPVQGIFASSYAQAFEGVSGADTTYMLPSTQAAAAAPGSTLLVGSTTWRVRSVQPDGTGVTLLMLGKV